jgi:DNA repair exonuclease SbcCD nuclease subunit
MIVVLSDSHIGRAVPRQIGDLRRSAYRNAFSQAIDVAIEEGAEILIHAGDVFEKRSMTPEDSVFVKEEFYRYFKAITEKTGKEPHIFMLRGNHDGSPDGNTIDYISHPMAKYVTVAAGPVDDTAVYTNNEVCIVGISFDRYLARKVREAAGFIRETFEKNPGKLKIVLIHGFIKGYHPIPKGTPEHTYTTVDDMELLGADLVISGHYHVPLDPLVVGNEHKTTFLNAGATEAENIGEGTDYGVHVFESVDKIRFIPLVPLQLIKNYEVDSFGAINPADWYVTEGKAAAEDAAKLFQSKNKDGIFRVTLEGRTTDDPFRITDLLERAFDDLKNSYSRLVYTEVVNNINNIVKQVDAGGFMGGVDFAADVLKPVGAQQLADAAAIINEVSAALDNRASKKTGLLTDSDRAVFVKKWTDVLDKVTTP